MDRTPDVIVASRARAEELLVSEPFFALISVRDPGSPRPCGVERVELRVELEFEDLLAPSPTCASPPTAEHVRRVVELATPLADHEGTILVHCEKGQSRSAGLALTLFALWLGPGREVEAMRRGLAVLSRPWASPMILDFADESPRAGRRALLGLQSGPRGATLSAWLAHSSSSSETCPRATARRVAGEGRSHFRRALGNP